MVSNLTTTEDRQKRIVRVLLLFIFSAFLWGPLLDGRVSSNACAAGGNYLVVFAEQEKTRPPGKEYFFVKGAVSRLVFVIENKGSDFVVIRSFSIEGQLPDIKRWYGSVYGSLKYRSIQDIWSYNQMDQCFSRPVCSTGVIPPGGKKKVVRWAVVQEKEIAARIMYQRLSKNEAAQLFYLYFNKEQWSGFKRNFKRLKNIDSLNIANVDWSLVVFPGANTVPYCNERISCPVSIKNPEFSLKMAQNKISENVKSAIFWKEKNAWIIQADDGIFLVSSEKILKLPQMDLLSFVIISSHHRRTDFILPLKGYQKFGAKKPCIEGPGYFNPGVTRIEHDNLIPLFEFIKKKGDSITILVYDPNGLGQRFYLLVGTFDEALRRRIAGKGE